MKLFRCFIEGVNFPLEREDEFVLFGFYATRYVRAASAEQAELLALEMLRADPALDAPVAKRSEDTKVFFEEIAEVASLPEDVSEPGTGNTFYRMGT